MGSDGLCSAHIVQISCFLNGVLQTSFPGPELPVHHRAWVTLPARGVARVSLSANRHCGTFKIWKAEGVDNPPCLGFCTAGEGASGSHLFLWLE